jgi:ketosteroid isomerase-like protein
MPADVRTEIRALLERINKSWLEGRFDHLGGFFHSEMVITGPDLRPLARGREACVESYRGFVSQAQIEGFREGDHTVDVFGNVAVATYSFDLRYRMGGRVHHASGRDSFVFADDGAGWRAVWRTMGVTVEHED